MATLTPVQATAAGAAVTYAAVNDGDVVVVGALVGRVVLNVKTVGTATNVTLTQGQPCSFGGTTPTHDVVVALGTNVEKRIVIPASCLDPVTGNATVHYSAVTAVTAVATYV